MITFDPVGHIYTTEDGQVIPSVTNIIVPLTTYYRVPMDKLRLAADRGTAVHKLTEQWDKYGMVTFPDCGRVCDDDCPCGPRDEFEGFLSAWKHFQDEHAFKPLQVELRVYHEEHGYAGTLDRIGRIDGDLSVIDIKTSNKVGPAMGVQLAAYKEAANAMYPNRAPIKRRFVVQLRADGTYALEEFTSVWDFPAFLGCLSLWHWQRSLDKPTEVRLQPPPLPRAPFQELARASGLRSPAPFPDLMPEQDYIVRDGHAIH